MWISWTDVGIVQGSGANVFADSGLEHHEGVLSAAILSRASRALQGYLPDNVSGFTAANRCPGARWGT
jgi:hypothetical protein